MDIKELMRISRELDEKRNLFGDLGRHAEAVRAAREIHSLNPLLEHSRRLSESVGFNHLEAISKGLSSSLVNDQVRGIAQHSAFAAARLEMDHGLRHQIKQLTEGFSATDALSRIIEDLKVGPKADVLGFSGLRSRIETETQGLLQSIRSAAESPSASALASLSAAVNAASLSATAALVRGFDSAGALGEHRKMMEQLFRPSFAYNHFAARTIEHLAGPLTEARSAALAGSLLLANEQAIRAAGLMRPLVDLKFLRDEALPFTGVRTPPIVNRYRVQREELLEQEEDVPDDADYETLATLAPSTNLFEQARRCLELVGMCDETSQTCAGTSVFKLTPMVLISFSGLLGTVARNRMTLAHVVENLYIVLYESAGKDKLRYIEGGYVTGDECEVIWKIKHLRNKWLSHDADHGKEGDIKKSWRARMDALRWLGVESMPTSKEDYSVIHQSLLSKVEDFLSLLLTRIAAHRGPEEGN